MTTKQSVLLQASELAQHYPDFIAVRRGIISIAGENLCKPHHTLLVQDSNIERNVLQQWQTLEPECHASGIFPCYFGTNEAFAESLGTEYRHALLGVEAHWQLVNWEHVQRQNHGIQASIHAALRHRVSSKELDLYEVQSDTKVKSELHSILRTWLDSKRLPALHFVAEADIFHQQNFHQQNRQSERRIFAAFQKERIIAYTSIIFRKTDECWYLDQFIRLPNAPNGTMELLIDHTMRVLASEQHQSVTLGLMPLAGNTDSLLPQQLRGKRFEQAMSFGAAYGSSLYNSRGLTHFKQKFQPESLVPLYLSYHHSTPLWRLGTALVESICGMSCSQLFYHLTCRKTLP
jgi:phosphatidylglycerol lysyltransferase